MTLISKIWTTYLIQENLWYSPDVSFSVFSLRSKWNEYWPNYLYVFCVFHCILPFVNCSPDVSSVSKLSQTGKENMVLNKRAKNPEVGKLTEADKASTGKVSRGSAHSATSEQRIHRHKSMQYGFNLNPLGLLSLPRSSCLCSGPIWKP